MVPVWLAASVKETNEYTSAELQVLWAIPQFEATAASYLAEQRIMEEGYEVAAEILLSVNKEEIKPKFSEDDTLLEEIFTLSDAMGKKYGMRKANEKAHQWISYCIERSEVENVLQRISKNRIN